MSEFEPWQVRQEIEGRFSLAAAAGLMIGLTVFLHPLNLIGLGLVGYVRKPSARVGLIAFAIIGLCLGLGHRTNSGAINSDQTEGRQRVTGLAKVTSYGRRTARGRTQTIRIGDRQYLLTSESQIALEPGDSFMIDSIASPIEDDSSHELSGRIYLSEDGLVNVSHSGAWTDLGMGFRRAFRGFCARSLNPVAAGLSESAWFGPDELDPQTRSELRDGGATTILSAGGLQLVMLAALGLAVLGKFPMSRSLQLCLVLMGLLVYVSACGDHPAPTRALIVWALGAFAYLMHRDRDVLNAIAWAAVIELLVRPEWIRSISFQLSFLVVIFVVLYMPALRLRGTIVRRLQALAKWVATSSLLVAAVSFPLLAYHAGKLNLGSPFVSCLVMPIVPMLDACSAIAFATSRLNPFLGTCLAQWSVAPLCHLVEAISTVGRSARAEIIVPEFSGYWLGLLYGLGVLGSRASSRAFRGRLR